MRWHIPLVTCVMLATLVGGCDSEVSGPGEPLAADPGPVSMSLVFIAAVPPPVSYWPADGHFLDMANGDNHGTPVGGVTFAPGRAGQAFHFDGTGEIEMPILPILSWPMPAPA